MISFSIYLFSKTSKEIASCSWRLFENVLTSRSYSFHTASQTPAGLLQQIASMRMGQSEDSTPVQLSAPVQLTPKPGDQNKNLIQVISSTVTSQPQPQQPQYQLTVNSPPSGISRSVKLAVQLPGVCSYSECQLNISQVEVTLFLILVEMYCILYIRCGERLLEPAYQMGTVCTFIVIPLVPLCQTNWIKHP